MTDPTMALMDYLSKFGLQIEDDVVREGVRVLIQSVIEAEVTQRIGAKRYERTPERVTQRNGYRERAYATRVGEVTLQVPKLREGSYLPSLYMYVRMPPAGSWLQYGVEAEADVSLLEVRPRPKDCRLSSTRGLG